MSAGVNPSRDSCTPHVHTAVQRRPMLTLPQVSAQRDAWAWEMGAWARGISLRGDGARAQRRPVLLAPRTDFSVEEEGRHGLRGELRVRGCLAAWAVRLEG